MLVLPATARPFPHAKALADAVCQGHLQSALLLLLPLLVCGVLLCAGFEDVVLVDDDELHVTCTLTLCSGKSCTYRQVYRRRG